MMLKMSRLFNPLKWPSLKDDDFVRLPHTGAKERARAKRCYESLYLNERAIDEAVKHGLTPVFHERTRPTICQQSKNQYAKSMREA